jgi:hypothetical protein
MSMPDYQSIAKWLNDNQGVLGLLLFLATLAYGWLSGIFSALRRKPKLHLHLIPGPTFCCTFPTGNMHNTYAVHRTGVALYLRISNTGSAATSLEQISLGYHCNFRPVSIQWLRFRVGWLWLNDPTAVIHDFQVKIGDNIKFYPFLIQSSILTDRKAETFLIPGQSTNGVIYFEQGDSWGGLSPAISQSKVHVKVAVRDTFGNRHTRKFLIPSVSMEEARKYNPSFGKTLAELRNESLPHDART